VLFGVTVAGVSGWLLGGGNMPSAQMFFGQPAPIAQDSSASGAPVHLDSTPSGAAVGIDGTSRGKTPLDTHLEPGLHALSMEQPESLAETQTVEVAETGASVHVDLWRRLPEVVPLRPVYPGASLIDAYFLNDGQLALAVGVPAQAGASGPNTEVWRLDPATGQLSQVDLPGLAPRPSVEALSPDGGQVAYVVPGSFSATSGAGWSTSGSSAGHTA
jgi:hypothetical protein